ncbi:hypothetical protein GCM10025868_09330 [Angustibacter aerolatus]|uniref:ABC transporter domain-containing protein n=1 Tax=Angustibacter aerolatus TaxID=1162965 RepID=A0ABQ6JE35_9ACTN|nr:hypothetical protein GCM10025868_09330 [Angustibacter aerolatus]
MGLLGRNGAGKSTLLKSVVAEPGVTVSGSVRVGDREVRGLSTYRICRLGVAWVPDDRRVFTALSVRENLEPGAHEAGARRPGSTGWSRTSRSSRGCSVVRATR